MIEHGFGVALYRIRCTFRRRWAGYLSLVLLVGLVGGLGLGSLAAARRTQSSFSTFLAGTNPSDLQVSIYSNSVAEAANPNYNPSLTEAIARLPDVRHVAAGVEVTGAPLTADGAPRLRVTGLAYPGCQRQRALLHPGPPGGHPRAPGVAAAARRDRDGARGRQALGLPRRSGDPVRLLLDCAAEPAGLRHQCRATGPARQHATRRAGVVELGDRGGRRRHAADLPSAHARVRQGVARAHERAVHRCPGLRDPDGRGCGDGAGRRARGRPSDPAGRHLHRPSAGAGGGQGRSLAQADLHRAGRVRWRGPPGRAPHRGAADRAPAPRGIR